MDEPAAELAEQGVTHEAVDQLSSAILLPMGLRNDLLQRLAPGVAGSPDLARTADWMVGTGLLSVQQVQRLKQHLEAGEVLARLTKDRRWSSRWRMAEAGSTDSTRWPRSRRFVCPQCDRPVFSFWSKLAASSIHPARCRFCGALSCMPGWVHLLLFPFWEGLSLCVGALALALYWRSWWGLVLPPATLAGMAWMMAMTVSLRPISASVVASRRRKAMTYVVLLIALGVLGKLFFGREEPSRCSSQNKAPESIEEFRGDCRDTEAASQRVIPTR